jgi:hypothetical protein
MLEKAEEIRPSLFLFAQMQKKLIPVLEEPFAIRCNSKGLVVKKDYSQPCARVCTRAYVRAYVRIKRLLSDILLDNLNLSLVFAC